MKSTRRQFVQGVGATGLALMAWCGRFPGQARPPARVPRIGFMAPGSPDSTESNPEGFRQGLQALGYIESQNIAVEWRFVEGQFDRLPAMWIVALAARTRLPGMYENRDWTSAGGLMAYGASVPGMYYRAPSTWTASSRAPSRPTCLWNSRGSSTS